LQGKENTSNNLCGLEFLVGRKNWLFSGSIGGADSIAELYSIIETAKDNDLALLVYALSL